MAIHGGCECGSVRYELARDTLPPVVCCHCLDCQTRIGSAFDLTAFVDPGEFAVTGPVVASVRTTPNGFDATCYVCDKCQTVIHITHVSATGHILLRAGTLDESQAIVPAAHMFAKRKQAWLRLPADVPVFDEFPTPEAMGQILGPA